MKSTLPPGYKRGSHGFIFRWNGFQYVRAELDPLYSYRATDHDGNIIPSNRHQILDGKKKCTGAIGCGEWFPLRNFGIKSDGRFESACRTCRNKHNLKKAHERKQVAA